jgi:hypothetical protein
MLVVVFNPIGARNSSIKCHCVKEAVNKLLNIHIEKITFETLIN